MCIKEDYSGINLSTFQKWNISEYKAYIYLQQGGKHNWAQHINCTAHTRQLYYHNAVSYTHLDVYKRQAIITLPLYNSLFIWSSSLTILIIHLSLLVGIILWCYTRYLRLYHFSRIKRLLNIYFLHIYWPDENITFDAERIRYLTILTSMLFLTESFHYSCRTTSETGQAIQYRPTCGE